MNCAAAGDAALGHAPGTNPQNSNRKLRQDRAAGQETPGTTASALIARSLHLELLSSRRCRTTLTKIAVQAKLAAAELKRQANLAAKSAAAQTGTVPETFLQRKAVARVWLRRQASSRKLQRMWRAFADRRQTTRQLAVSFIKSGITSLPVAHSPKAAAANNPSRAVFEPKGPVPTSSSDPNTSRASQPAIAWVGVNTHVTHGADLPPQEQTQDAFEKFAKAIQSPATLKSAKVWLQCMEYS